MMQWPQDNQKPFIDIKFVPFNFTVQISAALTFVYGSISKEHSNIYVLHLE